MTLSATLVPAGFHELLADNTADPQAYRIAHVYTAPQWIRPDTLDYACGMNMLTGKVVSE